MANENIGEFDAVIHVKGFVRKDAKGKLYIFWPEKGILSPRLPAFQDIILENAKMYGAPNIKYDGGGEPLPQAAANDSGIEKPEKLPNLSGLAQKMININGTKQAEKQPKQAPANDDGLSDYEIAMGYK